MKDVVENTIDDAILAAFEGRRTYCKFLAANDTNENTNQSGPLITREAQSLLFPSRKKPLSKKIKERVVKRSPNVECVYGEKNVKKKARFFYYRSKNEFRITRILPINKEYRGGLFILVEKNVKQYQIFILTKSEDKNQFLHIFNIPLTKTSFIINEEMPAGREKDLIDQYVGRLNVKKMPTTKQLSKEAHHIFDEVYRDSVKLGPDQKIIEWIRIEYNIFKTIENLLHKDRIGKGFASLDAFLFFAKKILNSRKSRAGKSFELHLKHLFEVEYGLKVDWQPRIDKKNIPDFLFPSKKEYDLAKEGKKRPDNVIFLAAKTTCKDRWRQIESEANSKFLKDGIKYLCTLEKGITVDQMNQMQDAKIVLVVPEPLLEFYPIDDPQRIMTLNAFVDMICGIQNKQ